MLPVESEIIISGFPVTHKMIKYSLKRIKIVHLDQKAIYQQSTVSRIQSKLWKMLEQNGAKNISMHRHWTDG